MKNTEFTNNLKCSAFLMVFENTVSYFKKWGSSDLPAGWRSVAGGIDGLSQQKTMSLSK